VNQAMPEGALEFAASARRAIVDAGGFELARRAEADPDIRTSTVAPLLAQLGVDELELAADEESAFAGVELCRLVGAFSLPYPVEAVLGCPRGDADFAALIDGQCPWIEHADLPGRWMAIDTEGTSYDVTLRSVRRNQALVPFARPVQLGEPGPRRSPVERALLLNLASARILGAVETAHGLTVDHVQSREQFGKPLAALQAVQFHVADSEVAVRGLRRLLLFTVSRWLTRPDAAWVDALALRTFAQETGRSVIATCELLHGATGFCDEHDLTVITRNVQGPMRLPTDLERTTDQLAAAVDAPGLEGLFTSRPVAAEAAGDGATGGRRVEAAERTMVTGPAR